MSVVKSEMSVVMSEVQIPVVFRQPTIKTKCTLALSDLRPLLSDRLVNERIYPSREVSYEVERKRLTKQRWSEVTKFNANGWTFCCGGQIKPTIHPKTIQQL